MPFDSFSFLLFFASVLLLDRAVHRTAARKPFLLIASWVFYAGWNPLFLPMLIATSSLDWWLARKLKAAAQSRKIRGLGRAAQQLSGFGTIIQACDGEADLSPANMAGNADAGQRVAAYTAAGDAGLGLVSRGRCRPGV